METAPPDVLGKLLNEYVGGMTDAVFAHEGTVAKIIGDAIQILFNAPGEQPDYATRAIACAYDLDVWAEAVPTALERQGRDFGATRIGVHAGPALVGNFGGSRFFDYTAYGDTINTAARLEAANKYLGTRICVSAAIADAVDRFQGRPVGDLVLRGRSEPLRAWSRCRRSASRRGDHAIFRSFRQARGRRCGGDAGLRRFGRIARRRRAGGFSLAAIAERRQGRQHETGIAAGETSFQASKTAFPGFWRAIMKRRAIIRPAHAMRRRELLGSLGSLAAAGLLGTRSGWAQAPGRVYRLGTFHPVAPMTETTAFGKIIVKVLAQHGYILGQNLTWDARSSTGDNAKIPALMQDLKAANVDAIILIGYPAAAAAKSIGVPAVGAVGLGDPVATHLIQSEAHPGGNITGISDVAATLTTKRLSLLKQLAPNLRKVAMIWNKDDLGMTMRYQASADAARIDWPRGAGGRRARAR